MTQSSARSPVSLDLPTFRPRPPQGRSAAPGPTPEMAPMPAAPATPTSPSPTAPSHPVTVTPLAATQLARSPLPPPESSAHLPHLPKGRRPGFSSHRNDTNATRAVELLTQVNGTVGQWHAQLRQVLDEIQAVYLAGPIVEGWLEAVTPEAAPANPIPRQQDAAVLRHGDPAHLARYVDHLTTDTAAPSAATQYRLCSLDADGRLQCQLCPPEQLGAISQAIARHQQLRTLVQRKQTLETNLHKAATALAQVCNQLELTDHAHPTA